MVKNKWRLKIVVDFAQILYANVSLSWIRRLYILVIHGWILQRILPGAVLEVNTETSVGSPLSEHTTIWV